MDTKPAPNCWTRNWKWLLPAGCLTGQAGIAGFFKGFVLGPPRPSNSGHPHKTSATSRG